MKKNPGLLEKTERSCIQYPRKQDVLCGRGGHVTSHPGNVQFRLLIDQHKTRYMTSTKTERSKITQELVDFWRKQDPPGRFLARSDPSKGEASLWHDIGNEAANKKVHNSLRQQIPTNDFLAALGRKDGPTSTQIASKVIKSVGSDLDSGKNQQSNQIHYYPFQDGQQHQHQHQQHALNKVHHHHPAQEPPPGELKRSDTRDSSIHFSGLLFDWCSDQHVQANLQGGYNPSPFSAPRQSQEQAHQLLHCNLQHPVHQLSQLNSNSPPNYHTKEQFHGHRSTNQPTIPRPTSFSSSSVEEPHPQVHIPQHHQLHDIIQRRAGIPQHNVDQQSSGGSSSGIGSAGIGDDHQRVGLVIPTAAHLCQNAFTDDEREDDSS